MRDLGLGVDPAEIRTTINGYATSFDVLILLVDERGLVAMDTEAGLAGHTVDTFLTLGANVTIRDDVRYRSATYEANGDKLLLFAPANETLRVSSSGLLELQTVIYELSAAGVSQETIDELVRGLVPVAQGSRTLPLPSLRPLVAVPEGQVASAWQDLIPQLAIAGGIAVAAPLFRMEAATMLDHAKRVVSVAEALSQKLGTPVRTTRGR